MTPTTNKRPQYTKHLWERGIFLTLKSLVRVIHGLGGGGGFATYIQVLTVPLGLIDYFVEDAIHLATIKIKAHVTTCINFMSLVNGPSKSAL